MNFSKLFIGKALKTEELKGEKLNAFWGLPIMASDAISSVAYAGSAILLILIPVLGADSYKYMFLSAICIVILMATLIFSYKQVIDSYPNGGGAYIVARENLGTKYGLIATSALTIDYILTVAVSTSSGTAAIISAFPQLSEFKVPLTLALIALITIGNLRGIRESSKSFGVPTYLFCLGIIIMIIVGIIKVYVFGYVPTPIYLIPKQVGNISLILFLQAFASGCTALTGIEAVSNGVPSFRAPAQKNAIKVLFALGILILIIFGGLSYLSTLYHAVPGNSQTMISQIATQIFGRGIMYYFIQITTALILILAANTAFTGLPVLFSIMAQDGYVPRQLSKRGKRLSFSNGIVLLFITASILIIVFDGDTDRLLPLYAVGVFISFTLAQTGMLFKWNRERPKNWKFKALINGIGAILSLSTTIIISATKFIHGAWIVFLLIPLFTYIMLKIKKHYNTVAKELKFNINDNTKEEFNFAKQKVIVPINTLNKSFLKAYDYANTITDDIILFHISSNDEQTECLINKWKNYSGKNNISVIKSPYREFYKPFLRFIQSIEQESEPNTIITIVLPEFVTTKWWSKILHNQTSFILRTMLLKKNNIVVISVPYLIENN